MLALISMDWTLNRRIVFQMSPILALWILVALSRGMHSLLAIAFAASALVISLPVLQNLRDTVEPYVCALPVSRRQIVLARYVSALGGMTLALGFFFLLGWTCHRLGLQWSRDIFTEDLVAGLGLQALILGSGLFLYLPFHFRFGGDLGLGLFTASLMACLMALLMICGWSGLLERGMALAARVLENGAFGLKVFAAWLVLGASSLGLSVVAYRRRITRRPISPALPVLLIGCAFLVLTLTAKV